MAPRKRNEFFCRYCDKSFRNPCALGGHQRAHKSRKGKEGEGTSSDVQPTFPTLQSDESHQSQESDQSLTVGEEQSNSPTVEGQSNSPTVEGQSNSHTVGGQSNSPTVGEGQSDSGSQAQVSSPCLSEEENIGNADNSSKIPQNETSESSCPTSTPEKESEEELDLTLKIGQPKPKSK